MDERAFVEQRKDSWEQLGGILDRVKLRGIRLLEPDEIESLGPLYRQVVSDLAYARTQNAGPDLIDHLNDLAGRAHGTLYAQKPGQFRSIVTFMLRGFPELVRAQKRYVIAAALVFFIGSAVAVYIAASNPDQAGSFVPGRLSSGPRGEDGAPDPGMMSSFIMTNNIRVGILAFASGISAGVLPTYLLFRNGAMLGDVAMTVTPAVGPVRFWSLILPHGFIELTAIFICGAAGYLVAVAVIAPGNMRRRVAIRKASRASLLLFAGTVPMFIIAGIIEGFVTPSVVPAWSKLAFSGLTLILLVVYFGWVGTSSSGAGQPRDEPYQH